MDVKTFGNPLCSFSGGIVDNNGNQSFVKGFFNDFSKICIFYKKITALIQYEVKRSFFDDFTDCIEKNKLNLIKAFRF